jgi:hypothetical protein
MNADASGQLDCWNLDGPLASLRAGALEARIDLRHAEAGLALLAWQG